LGSVIAHTGNLVQQLGEYNEGQFWALGCQDEGFLCQRDHGMFELGFGLGGMVWVGHQGHQGSGNDGHDEDGEQFLADAVLGLAVKGFDVEGGFLVTILEFDLPTIKPP
jgi:hypothetical protein